MSKFSGPKPRSAAAAMSNYAVGYGRPPKHTRFKKGQSGNPRGRPKGSRNLATDFAIELGERVTMLFLDWFSENAAYINQVFVSPISITRADLGLEPLIRDWSCRY